MEEKQGSAETGATWDQHAIAEGPRRGHTVQAADPSGGRRRVLQQRQSGWRRSRWGSHRRVPHGPRSDGSPPCSVAAHGGGQPARPSPPTAQTPSGSQPWVWGPLSHTPCDSPSRCCHRDTHAAAPPQAPGLTAMDARGSTCPRPEGHPVGPGCVCVCACLCVSG